jgi:hypothetical protein
MRVRHAQEARVIGLTCPACGEDAHETEDGDACSACAHAWAS